MATNRITASEFVPGTAPTSPGEISIVPAQLVSILIPCCGMLEYTKLCVPSVLKHSRSPFELIFLDIGSLDGTAEYLDGVATVYQSLRVEVVRTPTDLGIKDACKDALARARGQYLVLLNNDTIVTNSWLNQLIGLATMSPAIGAVGPMSNYAAPPQLVEAVPYRLSVLPTGGRPGIFKGAARAAEHNGSLPALVDVEGMHKFAGEYREQHRGKWLETDRLGGFCMLLKREALERIGNIDQWSDLGLFDTDILSSKARQAGYTLACCRDLFIHHFGTRTFAHGAMQEQQDKTKDVMVGIR